MREIGGYIELDSYSGRLLHEGAIALNCGRNALAYLLRARGIRKLLLPHHICDSVLKLCAREGVQVRFYHIGLDFRPEAAALSEDEWLYVVNYYGQLPNGYLQSLAAEFGRVIVDQAQAYFAPPVPGVDNIYTCRKFFGVADGAFLYTDAHLREKLPLDESFDRMHFLLGRFERPASEFYSEYAANNRMFADEPIKRMSRLTENLLRGIDYDRIKQRRTENFAFLADVLGSRNELSLTIPDGPFAYPLLIPNGREIKKQLIAQKIFVPTLWPNVLEDEAISAEERRLVENVVNLPCDQRYTAADMHYMAEVLKDCCHK